jgi:putative restriction endonuclease
VVVPFGPSSRAIPSYKLHYPDNAIVGGGTYVWSTTFPVSITWDAFEEKNGAATRTEMRTRILRYRRSPPAPNEDPPVGCIILEDPFFFAESDWIPTPADWRPNIVQGKTYDLESEIGRRLWDEVLLRRQTAWARQHVEPLAPMYGDPLLVRQRLGQGAFRMLVMDTYQRRCAVTKEKALPVLEASHIRPVSEGGQHLVTNGLLLRSDVHTLFDRGYVTITPSHEFRASHRLREEFDNGEEYFAMQGQSFGCHLGQKIIRNRNSWSGTTILYSSRDRRTLMNSRAELQYGTKEIRDLLGECGRG